MVPAASVSDALLDLAESGARAAVILSSGFAETGEAGDLDGRLRTFTTMAQVGLWASLAAVGTGGWLLPQDQLGWLGLALLTFLYGTAFTIMFIVLPRLQELDGEDPAFERWHFASTMLNTTTLGALVLALVLYMRNMVGVITPIITSATAAIPAWYIACRAPRWRTWRRRCARPGSMRCRITPVCRRTCARATRTCS